MHLAQKNLCFGNTLRRSSFWIHARRCHPYALMYSISFKNAMLHSSTLLLWTYVWTWNNNFWPRKLRIQTFFLGNVRGIIETPTLILSLFIELYHDQNTIEYLRMAVLQSLRSEKTRCYGCMSLHKSCGTLMYHGRTFTKFAQCEHEIRHFSYISHPGRLNFKHYRGFILIKKFIKPK